MSLVRELLLESHGFLVTYGPALPVALLSLVAREIELDVPACLLVDEHSNNPVGEKRPLAMDCLPTFETGENGQLLLLACPLFRRRKLPQIGNALAGEMLHGQRRIEIAGNFQHSVNYSFAPRKEIEASSAPPADLPGRKVVRLDG